MTGVKTQLPFIILSITPATFDPKLSVRAARTYLGVLGTSEMRGADAVSTESIFAWTRRYFPAIFT